ncbi:hypothetical protein POTOM_062210 [Populus tomentosa]|uniref:Uncharacterized protein n=1 Tax=Populus tomentosa TaxID=118781 RepID=A0A8X8BZ99_POPTO|nr:hypothetical protein POTOM_062210 [Populus tomentosa]
MASHQISETCAEHKISVADEDAQKVQRLRRAQWLRAAILGANDGLLSITSLMLGVGAAKEDSRSMVLSGLAGALAGACSMAVGEFVSVSTQRDIERETVRDFSSKNDGKDSPGIGLDVTATLASMNGEAKLDDSPGNMQFAKLISEPTQRRSPSMIHEPKLPPGMSPAMKIIQEDAKKSAEIMLEDDREEVLTNPYKASIASGLSFLIGSCVPLLSAMHVAQNVVSTVMIPVVASVALAFFGGLGAYLGGPPVRISAEEKPELFSPLPVLTRLDRLDRLLQFLEEKHSSSGRGRHAAKSVVRTVEAEGQCKALTSALEEVQHKGTLMWMQETLENQALQLSLEVDVENTSRSSSSTIQGPEKIGHDEVSTVLSKEDEQMIIANKEKQNNSLIDQVRVPFLE